MTEEHDDAELARQIIANSFYITTATCDLDGNPWIAPTMFWMDDQLGFFFVSAESSRHVQQIQQSPKCAVSMYDSTQAEGTGRGLQFGAVAKILPEAEQAAAAAWLAKRRPSLDSPTFGAATAARWRSNGRVVVQLLPSTPFFLNAWNGKVDTRQRVQITPPVALKPFA
jgi:uncharacterized protein YhbP (UPF0306 family)